MERSENNEAPRTGDPSGAESTGNLPAAIPADDKIDRFLKEGKISPTKPAARPWSPTTVVLVGVILIAAATCGLVIRDAIHLEMQQSKVESLMEKSEQRAPNISPFRR